ncbi:XRE family transcriptional regulator [Vibrio fluvialis]|nr:XRE family transcriptional regulator [Vibrio fluvialis]
MKLHDILKAERERRNISQTDIVFQLMELGVDVSNATISRVEKGSVPSWPIVKGYCDIFGWPLAELDKRLDAELAIHHGTEDEIGDKRKITRTVGREIPIVSWVQAGNWSESPYIEDHDREKRFIAGKLPKNTFGLIVSGTSMENCGGKHHFPDGSLILVNPDADALVNDFVVAVDEAVQEATFKQYIDDCGKKLLKPLNPQYPVMNVTETTVIKGVVFRVIDDKKL